MFHSARIRLTLWYMLILALITTAFSLVIYRVLTQEVDRMIAMHKFRIERLDPGGPFNIRMRPSLRAIRVIDPDLLEETKRRIIFFLVATDSIVLILSGGLAYLFAGRTLTPIKNMVDGQNQFISDASHELRTPLTSLKSAFEVFLRDKKPSLADAKNIMSESLTEVNKMQSLSDSLLQLAQYQKPNANTRFEEVSIGRILKEAVKRVSPIAKQKNINIKINTTEVAVVGDIYSLIDLFVILLDNALKYSPHGSEVKVRVLKKDHSADTEVIDEGIGIDKKDIPHIFDRFYRADTARTKSKDGGYGLGLSIAQKIVDLHHGKILVESIKGKGSAFTVKLPVKK